MTNSRRITVDWGHLIVLALIAGATIWYNVDARSVSTDLNNLLLLQPVAIVTLLLCLFVVPQCFTINADDPDGSAAPKAAEPLADKAASDGEAIVTMPTAQSEGRDLMKMLAMGGLLGLYVFSLGTVGFDASTLCGIFGYVLLLFVIEPMADIVLKIGPLEMFAVAIWGMLLLGSLGSDYVSRGLLAASLGILLGTVGMNTAGYVRGTMGIPSLLDGIQPVPAMIGLLAASQLLGLAARDYILESEGARTVSLRRILLGCWYTFRYPGVLLRGSIIGIVVGAVPGVGSSVGNLIAYAETKRTAKDSATFGKGNPKGVIAAESAVASAEGGSMATMLALGIPGGGATAILLAAFMMHNIVPGPAFIETQKPMVYAIILNNIVQAIALLVVGIGFIYVAANVVKVRTRFVLPGILVVATLGTYAVNGSLAGPITFFVFAVIGFALSRYQYPVSATVVGLLLGRMLETEFLRSYQLIAGKLKFIVEHPAALVIFALMVASMGMTLWGKKRQVRAERAQAAAMDKLARETSGS